MEYDLKVAGDSATGRARLHVDVLREGWVRVPAPAGLLVREARLDGRPVPLLDGDRQAAGAGSAAVAHRPRGPGRSTS